MKKLITTLAALFAACSCMLAQETETHNHWEWEVTMPVDGWRVSNALSSMGVYKNGTNIEFDVKDWKDSAPGGVPTMKKLPAIMSIISPLSGS